MRSSHFTDEQIIGMIKEQEAGGPTAEATQNPFFTFSFFDDCCLISALYRLC